MKELMATLSAMHEREHRQNKFMAMLQGIDLEGNQSKEEGPITFEEVKARAMQKITGSTELANAERFGFKPSENGTEYNIVGL